MFFYELKEVILNHITNKNISEDILLQPGIGEDSAVVNFGDEVLAVSSDPITGAVKNAGYIAVHVACNDIAAAGAEPFGIQVVLLLPENMKKREVSFLIKEINQTTEELGIAILGGHTEILDTISRPQIIITALGRAPKDQYVTTKGACVGDDLIVTKGVGIEGTYILADDFKELLLEKGVGLSVIESAKEYREKLSVLPESLIAARMGVNAMHDITEGGLYGAVREMAQASGKGFLLDRNKIQVPCETDKICKTFNLDPCGLISSGSLLISTDCGDELMSELRQNSIFSFSAGEITEEGYKIRRKNNKIEEMEVPLEDELWKFLEKFSN